MCCLLFLASMFYTSCMVFDHEGAPLWFILVMWTLSMVLFTFACAQWFKLKDRIDKLEFDVAELHDQVFMNKKSETSWLELLNDQTAKRTDKDV